MAPLNGGFFHSASVPGATGTTSWCASSAIGFAFRVAAGPGEEQAVPADHFAAQRRVHERVARFQVRVQRVVFGGDARRVLAGR